MFSTTARFAVAAICIGIAVSSVGQKPKPQPKPTTLGSMGTTQMPGAQCDIGKAYTLGKAAPLNVCLLSVEFAR